MTDLAKRSAKLYAVRDCAVCGDDDRYCGDCVAAAMAKNDPAPGTNARWAQALNRASGVAIALALAELGLACAGFSWATKAWMFNGLVVGFWVGLAADKVSKTKKAKRCKGEVSHTAVGPNGEYGAPVGRYPVLEHDRCTKLQATSCEQALCDAHCAVMCRRECPNHVRMESSGGTQ